MNTSTLSPILSANGKPFERSKPRAELTRAFSQTRRQSIEAAYDAASSSTEFANYWANADAYDADSANSKGVRSRLVTRSRYEVGNNGYADGIVQTLATDLVGVGPRLRMLTGNKNFNQAVETVWNQWAKRVQLRRKLWCMAHAKTQDGEAFGVLRSNPKMRHPIKLDIVLVETEQVQSFAQPAYQYGYIDGMKFDEFGNVEYYELLRTHPGGPFAMLATVKPEQVLDRFMLHWFLLRRPGQHRGVPEFRSTLQVGAGSRRWREATLAAAETAADISVWLKTNMPPDNEADPLAPMSTIEWQKRMAIAAPMGWEPSQMKAEHPNATYETFLDSQINEQARPKSMPLNKAKCNSASYNYASGRLDHQTYYAALDVEREDCNDLVLDKLFDLWWQEAVLAYGWNANPDEPPMHGWDWPKHPVADVTSEADANDKRLKNGSLTLSDLYSQNGEDFEDALTEMASDYGITEDEMRTILLNANLNAQNQQASMAQAENQAASQVPSPPDEDEETTTPVESVSDTENIQATALNGAQIASMVTIADRQAAEILPGDAAKAMLQAAFPSVSIGLISTIVDSIGKAPRQTSQAASTETQGGPPNAE